MALCRSGGIGTQEIQVRVFRQFRRVIDGFGRLFHRQLRHQFDPCPVLRERGVIRQQNQRLGTALRHQEPIERIAVQQREGDHRGSMSSGDGQQFKARRLNCCEYVPGIRLELARLRLDIDLPAHRSLSVDPRKVRLGLSDVVFLGHGGVFPGLASTQPRLVVDGSVINIWLFLV